MKNIKLITSDLDGTLLPYKTEQIDPEVFPLIEELLNRGVKFFAASGRQYFDLKRFFEPVADKIGYICDGGCITHIGEKLFDCVPMDQKLADEVIREIAKFPELDALASGTKSYYVLASNPKLIQHMREANGSEVTGVQSLFEHPEPYVRVSALKNSKLLENEIEYWKEKFGDRCTVQVGAPDIIDMISKNVNKSTALKKILQHYDISPSECVSFGDGDNDREILSYVGHGVAMENAHVSVKQAAKYTTDSVKKTLQQILEGTFPA